MKLTVIGIFFVSGCVVASESQLYEGRRENGDPSAPPAYVYQQPAKATNEFPAGQFKDSGNCVVCDCRGAQFCCAGDSPGNDSCIVSCCSTLARQLGADFFVESDKPAQD